MSPTAVDPPGPPPSFATEPPLTRRTIWLLCLVATPLVGTVLYYAWRKTYPAAAAYANRVSFVAWLIWLACSAVFIYVNVRLRFP